MKTYSTGYWITTKGVIKIKKRGGVGGGIVLVSKANDLFKNFLGVA